MIDQILKQYGMSNKESDIYKFCLSSWPTWATKIARETKINRTTVYSIANEMVNKGVLTMSVINNLIHFGASDPNILASLAEQKALLISANMHVFKNISEQWWGDSKVVSYTGRSWVMSMYEDVLDSKVVIKWFLWSFPSDPEVLQFIEKKFYPKKRKRKLYSKTLISKSIKLNDEDKDKYFFRERKQKLDLAENCIINLYGPNKIMFVEFSKNKIFGTITTNEKMYLTLHNIFDYIRDS